MTDFNTHFSVHFQGLERRAASQGREHTHLKYHFAELVQVRELLIVMAMLVNEFERKKYSPLNLNLRPWFRRKKSKIEP